MAEAKAGRVEEFADRQLRVRVIEGREVGIVRIGDEFHAWENRCAHAGGPVCQGRLMPRVEERLGEDRASQGQCFSATQVNIVCPWHGYEFDARTGAHQGDARLKLRRFPLRVIEGDLLVTV